MRNLLLAGTAVVALVAGAATVNAQSEDPTLRRPPAGQSQDRGGNAGGQERNRGGDAQRPETDQGSRRNQAGQGDEQQPRRNQADQGDEQQKRRNQADQGDEQQKRRNQQGQADEQPPRRNQAGQGDEQQPRRNQADQGDEQQKRRNQAGQGDEQPPRRNQADQGDEQQKRRNQGQAEDQNLRRNQQGENRDQADTNNRDRNRDQANRGGDNVRVKSSVNIVTKLDAPKREKVVVSFRERAKPLPRADFRIDVGVNVPRSVTLNVIPDEIIRDVPEYRSYRYVIVENEILIIEPDTYRIVEIIPEDEAGGGGRRSASLTIDRAKFSVIKRDLRPRARVVERQLTLREGDDVPDDIELESVPDTIIREVPQLRTYRYVYLQNEVVIVDPESRRVVEVIQ